MRRKTTSDNQFASSFHTTPFYAITRLAPFSRSIYPLSVFSDVFSMASWTETRSRLRNHLTIPPAFFSSSCVPIQYFALVARTTASPL